MIKWFTGFFRRKRLAKEIKARLEKLKTAFPEHQREIDLMMASVNQGTEMGLNIGLMFLKTFEEMGMLNVPQKFEVAHPDCYLCVSDDGQVLFKKTSLQECENHLLPSEKQVGRRVWLLASQSLSYTETIKRLSKKINRAQALVEGDKASLTRVIANLMEINPGQDAQVVGESDKTYLIRSDGLRIELEPAVGEYLRKKADFLQERKNQLAKLLAKKELIICLYQANLAEYRAMKQLLADLLATAKKEKRVDFAFKLDRVEGIKTFTQVEEVLDHIPPEEQKYLQAMLGQGIALVPGWAVQAIGLKPPLEPNSSVAKKFDEDMLPPEMVETPAPAPAPSTEPGQETQPQGLQEEIDNGMGL